MFEGAGGPGGRRAGVLATVTGVGAGLVGVLVFAVLGLVEGPTHVPDPVEAANPGSVASDPGRSAPPSRREPPSVPSAPPSRSSTTGPSWSPGPSADTPSPSGGAHADAPTENLRRLAAALRFTYKSTTGAMAVPGGLNLTAAVEISMLWDEVGPRPTRATQDYNNSTGNRSIFLFPAGDGRTRSVASVVTLSERNVDGAAIYAVRSTVTIEPLYDITISPLLFTLVTDCDAIGATEVNIHWLGAIGRGIGTYEQSMHENGSVIVTAFGRTYREVGQSSNIRFPLIVFWDSDPSLGNVFYGAPVANTNPSLPLGEDRQIDVGISDLRNSACVGRVRYGITFQLREYLYLD
jgi:hypothetical protein